MATKTEYSTLIASIEAAVQLAQDKRFIGFDGNYAGAGESALGVLQAPTEAGQQAPVMVYGIPLVLSGTTLASIGIGIESDANGKAVPHTTGALLAYLQDVATAADQEVRVKLL